MEYSGIVSSCSDDPLTDSPPTYIDTVLKSTTYTDEFLNNMGMKQICLTADMQLYKLAIQNGGNTLQCDLEPCTHCPCAWVPLVLS